MKSFNNDFYNTSGGHHKFLTSMLCRVGNIPLLKGTKKKKQNCRKALCEEKHRIKLLNSPLLLLIGRLKSSYCFLAHFVFIIQHNCYRGRYTDYSDFPTFCYHFYSAICVVLQSRSHIQRYLFIGAEFLFPASSLWQIWRIRWMRK